MAKKGQATQAQKAFASSYLGGASKGSLGGKGAYSSAQKNKKTSQKDYGTPF